ncbi:uncharacterized protein LOC129787819 isoform X2 [Lutzomyia longipalpis]|uniref:uncharacterized protein LOC129787819 isoform X2 n=1 Tax=Lutzomyia longipalpis TaxID=7200 RepID=UPI002483F6F6|nr:uncharacterized protein LOC129787819 isoform X2 [Lutzomyia longipalpis]
MEKNILYGGEVLENFPQKYKSLGEFYYDKLYDAGNETEIIDANSGRILSRKELLDKTERLAGYLTKLGIKPGHSIAIVSENRLEFPVVVLAAFFSGTALNPLSPTYTEKEILHAFTIVQPRVVFVSPAVMDKVKAVLKKLNLRSILIQLDEDGKRGRQAFNFSDIIKIDRLKPKNKLKPPTVDIAKTVALILLSSGTTGLQKCVQITHLNLLAALSSTMELFVHFERNKDVILTVMPWCHCFALMTTLRLLAFGVRIVSLPRFEEGKYIKAIEDYSVSVCFVAPPVMLWFSKAPILEKHNLRTIREIYSGSAPLSIEIVQSIQKRIPNLQVVYNGYGLTETTTGVLHADSRKSKSNSIGCLWRGIWGKVVHQETGAVLPPNTPGELCFKGGQVMLGYMGNEEETRNAIDADGWLHTGDIGYHDDDKEFFIVGRAKELIKYKGFQVPPAELEALLLGHPKVKDAAVIGLSDEVAGELPMALVVKKSNISVREEELIYFIDGQVSYPKKLRGGLKFVDEIPKNANGKIMRQELKKKYGKIKGFSSKL